MAAKKSNRKTKSKSSSGWLRDKRILLFVVIFGAIGLWMLRSSLAAEVFRDDFNSYANGLITSEYTFWSPKASDAKPSTKWEMTSGSLFAASIDGRKAAYSGYPTHLAGNAVPNPTTTANNNSAIFRLTSVPSNFRNVSVSFKLNNKRLASTGGTPGVAWDGIHVFLRYVSEENLYYASVNRRDGSLAIKKKVPGGPSNGGTYYTLAGTSSNAHPIPFNSWQDIRTSVQTNSNGTVTINIYRDGKLLLSALDNGSMGGAPITSPGKVGIRGDNAEFYFDDFSVDDPTVTSTPTPPPPSDQDLTTPTVTLTSPAANSRLTDTVVLSSNPQDNVGIAKVDYYDGSRLIGSSSKAPYTVGWNTKQVSNGTHTLSVRAYDTSQNSTTSQSVSVNVQNTTEPATDTISPTVNFVTPANNANVSGNLTVHATGSDNVGIRAMLLVVDGKYVNPSEKRASSTTGALIKAEVRLRQGSWHTITATAVDMAGNQTHRSVNVYVP